MNLEGELCERCCCGHEIYKLHYIAHKDAPHIWYQVGGRCVQRFKGFKHRVCEGCFHDFKVRKHLFCNSCRKSQKTETTKTSCAEGVA